MTTTKKWLMAFCVAIFFIMLYYLGPILTPFIIAAILAYLGNPLVNRLIRLKVPRTLAVTIVFVILFGIIISLLLILIPLLEHQIITLINKIPDMIAWMQNIALPWVDKHFHLHQSFDADSIKKFITDNWETAGSFATKIAATVTKSGFAFSYFLLSVVLVPVVTFYLLRDWEGVIGGMDNLLPRSIEPVVTKLVGDCNTVIGAFFRGQLLVMLGLAIYYSIALWIAGSDIALLLGIIIGLISIVPYLGFLVGIVVACIAAMVQYGDWIHIFYVLLAFGIGNALENFILAPILVGDRIGLHPVAVIFAILAGGQLYGFIGVLLALPVAAIIMVLLRYAHEQYIASELYERHEVE